MLTKNDIKFLKSLDDKKTRVENSSFLVEGTKIVLEVLSGKSEKFRPEMLIATDKWLTKNTLNTKVRVETADKETMERISSLSTTPDVILQVKYNTKFESFDIKNHSAVVLDNVRDPGNLGTIIRICNWFGINHLICSPTCADVYNPKTLQSSMGAFLRVQTIYTPLAEFIAKNQEDHQIYLTTLTGESIYKTKYTKPALIIFGNEANGVSEEMQKIKHQKITIPCMNNEGDAPESLNVAVSTGIVLSEIMRQ